MENNYDAARTGGRETIATSSAKIISFSRSRIRASSRSTVSAPACCSWKKTWRLPMVATNDSHYLCEEDAHAQDVMLCIQTGKSIQETNRMKFEGTQFFVKSHDEMYRVFKDTPDVLARTLEIAERCNLRLEKVPTPFPHFEVPDGFTIDSYFEHVTRQGFARRMEVLRGLSEQGRLKHPLSEYEQRLARELAIIQQMKFSGYFLIVWDFIRYARERNIPVGPGRGSAAGALVAYSLGITDIDPLQHELLFERFLNPERISMPDIDIDFCMNRRGEVITVRHRKIRPRQCGADHHVRNDGGEGGDQRRWARHGHALHRRRPHRQDGADDAQHPTRRRAQRVAADAGGVRQGSAGTAVARYRAQAGGIGSQFRRARSGRGDLAAAADRTGAAAQDQERRNRYRVRHGGHREDGPAQDGFSWADHADDSRRHGQADRADARKGAVWHERRCQAVPTLDDIPLEDQQDLRESLSQRADVRRVPV